MARMARIVVPGHPHHVTQWGNRRQQTFFGDDDYRNYIGLMAEFCGLHGVTVWAYCLMPNHVHLVVVPETEDGLRLAIGEAHRRYTRGVNFRQGWRGHLWQGRFASFVMDKQHLLSAVRYVERNPLRAKLVRRSADWKWSSAAAHLAGQDDDLVTVAPMLRLVPDWGAYLRSVGDEEEVGRTLQRHEATGRPLGGEGFLTRLENKLGRPLRPQKPGRKPKQIKK